MKTYTVEECWGLLLDSFGLTHFVKEFFVIAWSVQYIKRI